MNDQITIELNAQEAQVLLNFINIAVKTVGLDGAEAALHFKRKIDAAAQASQTISAPPPVEPDKYDPA